MKFIGITMIAVSRSAMEPKQILPGMVGELSNGFNIGGGDLWLSSRQQVLKWTWDEGKTMQFNGGQYAVPDQVTATPENYCRVDEVTTSKTTYSMSETLNSEARSHSTTLGPPKIDIGFEVPGVKASTSIQNQFMFGSSTASSDYHKYETQEMSVASSGRSQARIYKSQLSEVSLNEDAFDLNFKKALLEYSQSQSREAAISFMKTYGTHLIQEAELGGELVRHAMFSSYMDAEAANHYMDKTRESGVDFFFIHSHQSTEETHDVTTSSGEQGSVWLSSTEAIGGNPAASSGEEFCKSLEIDQFTPRVVQFVKLSPLFMFFDLISGVSSDASDNMKQYMTDIFFTEGQNCADEKCHGRGLCAWNPDAFEWEAPCQWNTTCAHGVHDENTGVCNYLYGLGDDQLIYTNIAVVPQKVRSDTWQSITADGQPLWAVGSDLKLYKIDRLKDPATQVSVCNWMTVRSHGGDLYAIGDDYHIYKKTSSEVRKADSCGDESWSQYDSNKWVSMAFANGAVYAVGDDNLLYERNNAGSWAKVRSDKWRAISAFGTKFWAIGDDLHLYNRDLNDIKGDGSWVQVGHDKWTDLTFGTAMVLDSLMSFSSPSLV